MIDYDALEGRLSNELDDRIWILMRRADIQDALAALRELRAERNALKKELDERPVKL